MIEELLRLQQAGLALSESIRLSPPEESQYERIAEWVAAVKAALGPEHVFWANPFDSPVKYHPSASQDDYENFLMERNLITMKNLVERFATQSG